MWKVHGAAEHRQSERIRVQWRMVVEHGYPKPKKTGTLSKNMFLGRRHPTEQHEILDGIYPKPGGAYIHSVYSHRRVLDISRQIFHVAPWVPLRQNMLVARSD